MRDIAWMTNEPFSSVHKSATIRGLCVPQPAVFLLWRTTHAWAATHVKAGCAVKRKIVALSLSKFLLGCWKLREGGRSCREDKKKDEKCQEKLKVNKQQQIAATDSSNR